MNNPGILIGIVAAYLCGSIPFALLIGKSKGVDLRKAGSGNIGATNCGRVLGKRYGFFCFGLDVLKGFAPVFGTGWACGLIGNAEASMVDQWLWLATAAAAVVGHVFPVWLRFKGGKGVATGLGVILGVWPHLTIPALLSFGTWLMCVAISRYVGISSVLAAVLLPVYLVIIAMIRGQPLRPLVPYLVVTSLMAILVVIRHRGNIARTIAGTEAKISFGKSNAKNDAPPDASAN